MIYAIGDIHGQAAMLDAALALIAQDGGNDAEIVFLGDYTDRGLDSSGVIDRLIAGRDAGRNWTFIKGNHDRFFSHFVQFGRGHDPRVASGIHWLNPKLGGTNTLASYGVTFNPVFHPHEIGNPENLSHVIMNDSDTDLEALVATAQNAVPDYHLSFLDSLPLTHAAGELLFVHAGIKPGLPITEQDPEDLLWIRQGWLDDTRDHGPLIVHGHTALETPQHHGNRVNLDGGAGYGRPLIPAVFEGRDCWLLTPEGRIPLRPVTD